MKVTSEDNCPTLWKKTYGKGSNMFLICVGSLYVVRWWLKDVFLFTFLAKVRPKPNGVSPSDTPWILSINIQ